MVNTTSEKMQQVFKNVAKLLGIIICLYFFVCSLEVLSTGFKMIAGQTAGDVFNAEWLSNPPAGPLVGLMIGVLGTVLLQSSSTFTSIIVAAIGAGMNVRIAVPMMMGANVGTSVTSTLVAMTQIANREEFERAFAAATVHDMFNWSTVILLFTLECLIGLNFLEQLTDTLSGTLIDSNASGANVKVLSYITDPLVKSIVRIDESVLEKWSGNQTCDNCRLLVTNCTQSCKFFFSIPALSDQSIGSVLVVLSLIVLCVSLICMVKILNSLLQGPIAGAVKRFINPKFRNPIFQYLFGYWNVLLGAISTIVLQSSSIFTSTLTPMVGIGLVEVETVYPLFLGSNIGTTFTAILAALTQSGSKKFKNTVQGALIHLFFNVIGILIFFPIPFLRIPIPMCKKLGQITANYRWFALFYIFFMFFLMPGIFIGLALVDGRGIAMYSFLAITGSLLAMILILNFMQRNEKLKRLLPDFLQNWAFLPEALRSLDPYDRFLTGFPCCKKFNAVEHMDFERRQQLQLDERKFMGQL